MLSVTTNKVLLHIYIYIHVFCSDVTAKHKVSLQRDVLPWWWRCQHELHRIHWPHLLQREPKQVRLYWLELSVHHIDICMCIFTWWRCFLAGSSRRGAVARAQAVFPVTPVVRAVWVRYWLGSAVNSLPLRMRTVRICIEIHTHTHIKLLFVI